MDNEGKSIRTEEKNVELYQELIERYSKENDIIMDCFVGTG